MKNIKLNALTVYDNRYIKTKIRTYGDKVCTNFSGLNVPDNDVECELFIDSLLVNSILVKRILFTSIFRQLHLKIVNTQMIDYLDDSLLSLIFFLILMNVFYKCCITIELTSWRNWCS